MEHKNDKKSLLRRLKIINGHLKSVEQMVENDSYCLDVVHQSRAIQSALKKVDLLLIESHLKNCVVDQIKSGQELKSTEEILKLFEIK